MFTIKKKIIFSNLAVVIFASALIAIPVINMQMTTIKENVTDNANAQVAQACAKINSFLLKPSTIVNDMSVFVSSHDIEQSEAEQAFDATISEVVASSKVSSQSFKEVNDQIMNTDQLVRQIRAACAGNQQNG